MKYIKTYEENIDKSTITELDLSYKNLAELPDLSEYINLKYLYCDANQLTELPELPKSLMHLYCNNNQLTELPELPNSLEYLSCKHNNLPYYNLEEYKVWYANTYPERVDAEKYNL